jgi:peroxiredoxin 2/4
MIELKTPKIGEAAPDFSAPSTAGELRLSNWLDGRWVIVLGYPAAFTPVSVTEFKELTGYSKQLGERNAHVLAISPDTVYSLIAFQRDLKERFQVNVDFPLVSDTKLKIANLYGMMHPGASLHTPVRATYILDPKRTVRYCAFYPLANGRSMAEVIRILSAIQASDTSQAPTPAEWTPGKPLLSSPPSTYADVQKSLKEGEDFYLRYQEGQ